MRFQSTRRSRSRWLLRVGPATVAAHLFGQAVIDPEHSVGPDCVTGRWAAGHACARGVEDGRSLGHVSSSAARGGLGPEEHDHVRDGCWARRELNIDARSSMTRSLSLGSALGQQCHGAAPPAPAAIELRGGASCKHSHVRSHRQHGRSVREAVDDVRRQTGQTRRTARRLRSSSLQSATATMPTLSTRRGCPREAARPSRIARYSQHQPPAPCDVDEAKPGAPIWHRRSGCPSS